MQVIAVFYSAGTCGAGEPVEGAGRRDHLMF